MRSKVLFTTLFVLFLMSITAQAQINLTSHEYFVRAYGRWYDAFLPDSETLSDNDSLYSPLALNTPFSVDVDAQHPYGDQGANAQAEITRTGTNAFNMYTGLYAEEYAPYFMNSGSRARAESSIMHSGTFTATQNKFLFGFDLEYVLSAVGDQVYSSAEHSIYLSLDVYSGEDWLGFEEVELDIAALGVENEYESDTISDIWEINTTIGQEVYFIISLNEECEAKLSANAGHNSVNLDYTLTEVPEPASLMLLLLGGITLRRRNR